MCKIIVLEMQLILMNAKLSLTLMVPELSASWWWHRGFWGKKVTD